VWVLRALAQRLGLADFFPWSSDSGPLDAILDHLATGHATVAALAAEGGMRALNVSAVAHPDLKFPTPSEKIELYSSRAAALGLSPLPEHEEPAVSTRYPLTLQQGRTLTHFHGFYDHGQALPTLAKADPGPALWISPADAAARGVTDGATIRIHNERGVLSARALVTERIPPGTVWMRDGWLGLNDLTAGASVIPDTAVDAFGFSGGQAAFDARVEVERV
jgi:anaerobic selenocysteine-containing dehydrogenase